MFVDWTVDRRQCVSLGCFWVPLCDAEEAGWGAVASTAFVSVTVWAVEVVKGILVGASALATHH